MRALWDSWTDDAIVRDQAAGRYFDRRGLAFRGWNGRFFRVGGPLNLPRPPQGHPVIIQAGASGPGRSLASRIADVVFTASNTVDDAVRFYDDVKQRAVAHGRSPEAVLVMPGLSPVVGRSESEAREKLERLHAGIDVGVAVATLQNFMPDVDLREVALDAPLPELPLTEGNQSRQRLAFDLARRDGLSLRQLALRFAGTRGHWCVAGTASQVADQMEALFQAGGADGFNVMPPLFPDMLADFTREVVPELQRRGLFRTEYEASTLRGHLGLERRPLRMG